MQRKTDRTPESLPSGSKDSDVSASYRDGVLEVRVPVAERSETTSKIQ